MITETYKVNGMKCDHCRQSVEDALGSVSGVSKAEVDLPKGEATVTYDEIKTTPQALKEAVDALGRFELEV